VTTDAEAERDRAIRQAQVGAAHAAAHDEIVRRVLALEDLVAAALEVIERQRLAAEARAIFPTAWSQAEMEAYAKYRASLEAP